MSVISSIFFTEDKTLSKVISGCLMRAHNAFIAIYFIVLKRPFEKSLW